MAVEFRSSVHGVLAQLRTELTTLYTIAVKTAGEEDLPDSIRTILQFAQFDLYVVLNVLEFGKYFKFASSEVCELYKNLTVIVDFLPGIERVNAQVSGSELIKFAIRISDTTKFLLGLLTPDTISKVGNEVQGMWVKLGKDGSSYLAPHAIEYVMQCLCIPVEEMKYHSFFECVKMIKEVARNMNEIREFTRIYIKELRSTSVLYETVCKNYAESVANYWLLDYFGEVNDDDTQGQLLKAACAAVITEIKKAAIDRYAGDPSILDDCLFVSKCVITRARGLPFDDETKADLSAITEEYA